MADNVLSLYGVQVINYVVPLLLIPFLSRRLGAGGWGDFAFADGFARCAMLLVEYGFQLSGARDIACLGKDPHRESRLLAGVLAAQLSLMVAISAFSIALVHVVPAFAARSSLLAAGLFWAFAQASLPLWYFQGRERLRPIALLDAGSKVTGLILVLLLVRGIDDGPRVFLAQGSMALVATVVAFMWIYRAVPWSRPSLACGLRALSSGGLLFVYRATVTLFTTANVVILGLFASSTTVGYFAGAEKLCRAAIGLYNPINQAIYPRISRLLVGDAAAAATLVRRSAGVMITLGVGVAAIAIPLAEVASAVVLGAGFERSVAPLRILLLMLPVVAAVNVMGLQWLFPMRMDKEVILVIGAAGVANVLLALAFVPGWQEVGMAWSVASAQVIVCAGFCIVIKTKRINPFLADESGRRAA